MDKSQELREVLLRYLDADLERIIFSNPRTRESYLKLTVRPLLLRGALAFQTEEFTEKQAFQKNQNAEKTAEYLPLPQCGDRVASRDCQYSDQ